jgi:hypothetical protein
MRRRNSNRLEKISRGRNLRGARELSGGKGNEVVEDFELPDAGSLGALLAL